MSREGLKESFRGGTEGEWFIFLSSCKYGNGCKDHVQCRKFFTNHASLFSGEPNTPVVIRLEGSILVESQILGLLICQLCQVGIKGGQV